MVAKHTFELAAWRARPARNRSVLRESYMFALPLFFRIESPRISMRWAL
jgi:hypothetical protein